MATLHPFRAVRPQKEFVEAVACVPYDVINTEEARILAKDNPRSFLHVIRPEIDLPESVSEYDDAVYETGATNLREYVSGPASIQDPEPSLYVYRLVMDGRAQTGVFGCVSVADYDADIILKHEKTRPSKEDDRTRHITTQRAHAEPIMLTFRDSVEVDRIVRESSAAEPLYDFVAVDGVRHTIWRVSSVQELVGAFGDIEKLYVADGHHRCKAASRAAESIGGSSRDEVQYFPAVLFPMGQMAIMPYNRIIKKLPVPAEEIRSKLDKNFGLSPGSASPSMKGTISIYFGDEWLSLRLPATSRMDAASSLDVAMLGEHILEPILGIQDPRTDSNIDFVGGIRGTEELERLVENGSAQMAISMFPTTVEELVDVSDNGLLMPPKSTWFEPKLRSGLLVHLF